MENVIISTSKQLAVLEKATLFLNERLFESKLKNIKIVIMPDRNKTRTLGWAWKEKWIDGEKKIHELNITATSTNRLFKEIWGTLVHELIHIIGYIEGVKTTRGKKKHNKEFKRLCDKYHLLTIEDSELGYITPHDTMKHELQELYDEFLQMVPADIDDIFKAIRVEEVKVKKDKPKRERIYICEDEECCKEYKIKAKGLDIRCACGASLREEVVIY